MKKHKSKIIAGVIIAIVLAFVFWYGGDAPSPHSSQTQTKAVSENGVSAPTDLPDPLEAPAQATVKEQKDISADSDAEEREPASAEDGNRTSSVQTEMVIDSSTGKDKYNTDPVPDGKPLPEEPQEAVISDKEYTCTLSVRCDTILKNLTKLDKEKADIVPKDGDKVEWVYTCDLGSDVGGGYSARGGS